MFGANAASRVATRTLKLEKKNFLRHVDEEIRKASRAGFTKRQFISAVPFDEGTMTWIAERLSKKGFNVELSRTEETDEPIFDIDWGTTS